MEDFPASLDVTDMIRTTNINQSAPQKPIMLGKSHLGFHMVKCWLHSAGNLQRLGLCTKGSHLTWGTLRLHIFTLVVMIWSSNDFKWRGRLASTYKKYPHISVNVCQSLAILYEKMCLQNWLRSHLYCSVCRLNPPKIGWYLLKPVGTCWNLLKPVGTCWNLLKPVETSWNLLKPVETCWNLLKPVETCWNLLEPVETCWNLLKPLGTCWNLLKPVGTSWNLLEPVGTTWKPKFGPSNPFLSHSRFDFRENLHRKPLPKKSCSQVSYRISLQPTRWFCLSENHGFRRRVSQQSYFSWSSADSITGKNRIVEKNITSYLSVSYIFWLFAGFISPVSAGKSPCLMVKVCQSTTFAISEWNPNVCWWNGVSWNRATPKSSILMGCSIINKPFGGHPHFREPPKSPTEIYRIPGLPKHRVSSSCASMSRRAKTSKRPACTNRKRWVLILVAQPTWEVGHKPRYKWE